MAQASHLGYRSIFASEPLMDARFYNGFSSELYYGDVADWIWEAMVNPAKRLLVIAPIWWS